MFKNKSKILILVEGAKTDLKLMKHLLSIYGITNDHEIVSYNSKIYALYEEMFHDNDPESMDLLQVLKERESDPERKKIFDQFYSDILLIFDLDPQDQDFSATKIKEMLTHFNESTEYGKLYLNYPMVEAFYHMSSIPDPHIIPVLYRLMNCKITHTKHASIGKIETMIQENLPSIRKNVILLFNRISKRLITLSALPHHFLYLMPKRSFMSNTCCSIHKIYFLFSALAYFSFLIIIQSSFSSQQLLILQLHNTYFEKLSLDSFFFLPPSITFPRLF